MLNLVVTYLENRRQIYNAKQASKINSETHSSLSGSVPQSDTLAHVNSKKQSSFRQTKPSTLKLVKKSVEEWRSGEHSRWCEEC